MKEESKATRLIKSKMCLFGFSPDDMAIYMHMSRSTFDRKVKDPKRLTMNDVQRMKKKLHITEQELVQAIF